MKTQTYAPHVFALSALILLGNAVILTPKFSAISVVAAFLIMCFVAFLLEFGKHNKAIYFTTVVLTLLSAIYGAVTSFLDYISFLRLEQMPKADIVLPIIMFLVAIAFLGFSKITVIYKYALIAFCLVGVVILLCLAGGFKIFDYSNFNKDFLKPTFSVKIFLRFFSSAFALPLLADDKQRKKAMFLGLAVGFLFIFVIGVQAMFTLGLNNTETFKYLKSVAVISSGSLFTRLDGLVYFVFFVTSLLKSSFGIIVVKNCMYK